MLLLEHGLLLQRFSDFRPDEGSGLGVVDFEVLSNGMLALSLWTVRSETDSALREGCKTALDLIKLG
jgi:hypothetical protein